MGLGKSKAGKPGQMNGAFANQPGFASAGQSPFGNGPLSGTGGGFGAPGPFGPAPGQFGPSATGFGAGAPVPPPFGAAPPPAFSSNQMSGFPPFPPQPQPQGLTGFPPASLFQAPMGPSMGPPSSGYPVSYQNQTFRPLIPGYAPAPGNDRRGNVMAQDHDQGDRFYNDQHMGQMHQMPPMNQSVKSRKH